MKHQNHHTYGMSLVHRTWSRIWCLGLLWIILSGCNEPKPAKTERKTDRELETISTNQTEIVNEETQPEVIPEIPVDPVSPEIESKPIPATNYRRPDTRPVRDARLLAAVGIHKYESQHLLLYTDIAPEFAKELPDLIDAIYPEWERYFSPLPPDRDGKPFQMTGFLMKDRDLFRQMGLLPDDLPKFLNGRHRDREFWMNEQEFDYYRRHLLLHEATHCFMSVRRNNNLLPPVWYMEGMAEFFATHIRNPDGDFVFRVMPTNNDDFAGLGRISLIQQAVEMGGFQQLQNILNLTPNDFLNNEAYAWSWALCYWLDTHPEYSTRFRELGKTKSRPEFLDQFEKSFQADAEQMTVGWGLFASELTEGYDVIRAAITMTPPELIADASLASIPVRADRGWQSSGVEVTRGTVYEVLASGRVTLANEPKPWVSEPGGITFDYVAKQPLGRLMLAFQDESPGLQGPADGLLKPIPIGLRATFTAPVDGRIFLRINDRPDSLADNSGRYSVTIRAIPE